MNWKKLFKYLILFVLFSIIIYYSSFLNVKAYTISNDSLYICDSSNNVSTGLYNYILDGQNYTGYFGTTYQGAITAFSTRFNATIEQGNSYTIEINSYTGDFRNISVNSIQLLGGIGTHCNSNLNAYTITSVSSSYYKIIINFIANSTNNYSQLSIYNFDGSQITGITNFKIDSMTLVDNGNSGTNAVIDNQNQNKQDIIDNQNENSNTIIDNQNQNTQDIIDNQNENQTCPVGPHIFTSDEWSVEDNKYLNSAGELITNNSYSVSPYLILKPNTEYTITLNSTSNSANYCFYNSVKNLISCNALSSRTITFTTGSNVQYLRTSLGGGIIFNIKGPVCNDWEQEKLNQTNEELEELNENITDETPPDTDSLGNAAGWLPAGPVDSLLNLPITFFTTLLGKLDATCSPIVVELPFVEEDLTLPCLSTLFSQLTGFNTFWSSFGLIAGVWCLYKYFIALYKWVEHALSFDEKESLGKWGGV